MTQAPIRRTNRLFYFGILPGLFFQFIGAYFYFIAYAESTFASVIYTLTKILLVGWPILWWFGSKGSRSQMQVQGPRNHKRSIILGVLSGLAIAAGIIILFFAFEDYFREFAPQIKAKAVALNILKFYIPFALFLSIAHSFLEEYYWRWFIFRGLLIKVRPFTAGIIASLAFASHHVIVISQFTTPILTVFFSIGVALLGALWCWIYHSTRSVWGAWISHIFADVGVMVVGYFLLY